MAKAAFTSQLDSKSFALLGNVICTVMLSGNDTDGQIGLVEIFCPQGAGPGPHTDPWRESFYVIEGEIEFMIESEGLLKPRIANAGDSVSIPAGLGHAFRADSQSARALIISAPAGLEAFFADAGEPLSG
jgi:quercetin dioxygenase-like cupin family protein